MMSPSTTSTWLPYGLSLWLAGLAFFIMLSALFYGHPPLRRSLVTLYQLLIAAVRYLRRYLAGDRLSAGPSELASSVCPTEGSSAVACTLNVSALPLDSELTRSAGR